MSCKCLDTIFEVSGSWTATQHNCFQTYFEWVELQARLHHEKLYKSK